MTVQGGEREEEAFKITKPARQRKSKKKVYVLLLTLESSSLVDEVRLGSKNIFGFSI